MDVWIRHVVVPGITDKPELLTRLGAFIGTLPNVKALDVLPYHIMGVTKYHQLGIPYSSVLYTLLREFTAKRVAERGIDPEKLRDQPIELKSKFKENRERKKKQKLLKQMKELAAKHAEKQPKNEK